MKATKSSKWERLHMLVHMALTTGARRGELIGLKWSDINFNTRTAHLAVTKNGSQRVLSLTADLLTELSKFREIGASFVFPHPSGLNRPFTEFDYHWQAAKKAALLSDFHFHDLRHSCASLLAMNGACSGQLNPDTWLAVSRHCIDVDAASCSNPSGNN
nr:site-specific integrase [Aeromonas veronii]